MEPSGSGISALWARTTALRYNTNVVVGYPEKVDISPNWPTGPEYYNSAILVNGDGETVANYRKSFLYPLDETWALEGKHGFFADHVPGLGNTAMGICKSSEVTHHLCCLPIKTTNHVIGMDLNPYRFEAPWHAFEFAFHILEARANLVIITMAWLTREDSKSFTRMPNEPDMNTLAYWAQRLEPVIRNESSEEIIVVFCNRTGLEGNAVYAGTSAVIGIQEGEVKVYGLLGRGVKELLLIDTDDPPIAKMVQRDDGAHVESQNLKPRTNNRRSRADSSTSATSSSTKHGDKNTRRRGNDTEKRTDSRSSKTRQSHFPPEMMERKRKKKPPVRIDIPKPHQRHTSSVAKTPVDESPVIPTPTAPSPTPQSKRPQLQSQGLKSPENYVDTPYPPEDYDSSEGQRFDVSGSIALQQDQDEPGIGPDKYFWMPSSSLLEPISDPPRWVLPEIPLPPASPVVASTLIKYPNASPRRSQSSGKRDASPKRPEKSSSASDRSEKSGRAGRPHTSREPNQDASERPATTKGVRPARPASPKSRNASRSGRHERSGSEVQQTDISVMVERLEALRQRTQSAMSQRAAPAQPRPASPKSRNASRSGRPNDIDHALLERTLNISRTSIRIGASDSILAASIERPRSDILAKDQRQSNGGSVRPPSRNRQQSVSDPDRPSSRGPGLLKRVGSPVAHIEPEESRTMLWSEISRIVGEHIGRPESQEAPRGRQRNDSASSMKARPGSRGVPVGGRNAASLSRQANGTPIRSVRYPSQGPPANPDDEIVAEIIFHRPGDPAQNSQNSRSDSTEAVVTDASSGRNSRQSQSNSAALPKSNTRPPSTRIKEAKQSPAPAKFKEKRDAAHDPNPPGLSGVSTHTLNSAKTSPKTPPPRSFEPSTPKAMVFEPDYGSLMSTTSDPLTLSDFKLEHLHAFLDDKSNLNVGRPRSAMM